MGLLLFLLSKIITFIVVRIGIVVGIVCDLIKYPLPIAYTKSMDRFKAMAVAVDVYGNTSCPELLQFLFTVGLKKGAYPFGKKGETVSYAIGMNKDLVKLNKKGKTLCSILIDCKDPLNT